MATNDSRSLDVVPTSTPISVYRDFPALSTKSTKL
jgi:hypothetical protein